MGIATAANATVPSKVTRSYKATRPKRPSFGPRSPKVRDIDALASTEPGDRYEPRLAHVMSVVSTWAYADERALADKLRYYGIEGARVRRIAVQNNALLVDATAYFIQSASGRTGILAFRGTDPASLINILSDVEVMQRQLGRGLVHSGFYANVEAVWDDLIDCLEAAQNGEWIDQRGERVPFEPREPLRRLYITGHSLGGAMGVLAAARLLNEGFEEHGSGVDTAWARKVVSGIYTFGQPMVGDPSFAAECASYVAPILFRHVYRKDVVPHSPPRAILASLPIGPGPARPLTYAHFGSERRSRGLTDRWATAPESSRPAIVLEAALSVVINLGVARAVPDAMPARYSIDDHKPLNYEEVSRASMEPAVAALAPAWRSVLEVVVPLRLRRTVLDVLGGHSAARDGGRVMGPDGAVP